MNSEEIKVLRKKLKLSQERFAKKINVSVMTVNRWEKGKNEPCYLALEKLERLVNEVNKMNNKAEKS